jgi:hypothetical protein
MFSTLSACNVCPCAYFPSADTLNGRVCNLFAFARRPKGAIFQDFLVNSLFMALVLVQFDITGAEETRCFSFSTRRGAPWS